MLAFLVAVRDALVAMALAWVGVTLESRVSTEPTNDQPQAEHAE